MTIAQRVQATRAYLAAAALVGAAIVFVALANLHPVYGVALASAAALAALWRWRGVFSRRRVLLWLEERLPEMRYALVSLAEAPDTRFRAALEARVRGAPVQRIRRVLALAALRLVGIPLVLLLVMQLMVRPLIASIGSDHPLASLLSPSSKAGTDALGGRATFAAIVRAPSYTGVQPDTVANPVSIAALVGSDISFVGRWTGRATMPRRPTVLRLRDGATERLVALEPRADSAPRVVLDLPARDTVLPIAAGVIPASASVRDDIGVVSGWFEIIISSGSGESFKFRSGVLGRRAGNGERELALASALRLDSLQLEPGDVVHLRAVARDANPSSDAIIGSSETRTLRVYRSGESDSVAIEAAPPPEVGRSEVSQRMLIIMTEKLAGQLRKLSRQAVLTEAGGIARDQSRLRKRVGQIIFTRLTGEEEDEGAEAALADTVSPAEALLRAADSATGAAAVEPLEPEGEDSPILAVNRPLLEAFNAMWEAERRLGVGEPRAALPHMRAALAAIQRARAAERLYLRGRPPKIVLDLARIRLQGKREGIAPGPRAAGANLVAGAAARRARFQVALELLAGGGGPTNAPAAIDTLTLVRVDALSDQPGAAAALSAAIDDLRAGRDATASLRAARTAVMGAPQTGRSSRWSGGGSW